MKILRLDYVVTHYGLSKSPPPLGLFPLPIVTSPGPASLRVGFGGTLRLAWRRICAASACGGPRNSSAPGAKKERALA